MISISQIYARFGPETDRLYRQAMLVASRHRVVRCHHLLQVTHRLSEESAVRSQPDTPDAESAADDWRATVRPVLAECSDLFDSLAERDPTGCLDSPMTNSPTMRRVLRLSFDRAAKGTIAPATLFVMGLACWGEEVPSGPTDETYRRAVGRLLHSLRIKPLPAFQFQAEPEAERGVQEITRPPTVEELNQMIGPAVTSDGLIDLYLATQRATDPAEKARLAAKLAYLRDRG